MGRPLWLGDTKRLVSTEQRIVLHSAKRRYLGKLSGPLLDRVDLRVQMYRVRTAASLVPRPANARRWCARGSRAPVLPALTGGGRTVYLPMPRSRDRFCVNVIGLRERRWIRYGGRWTAAW